MSTIEARIAEVQRLHYLWDTFERDGQPMARCRCDVDHPSITNGVPDGGWMTFDEYLAHVAEKVVAELGLTQEHRQHPESRTLLPGGCEFLPISVRYVTAWEVV